jgi:hypothetical protein
LIEAIQGTEYAYRSISASSDVIAREMIEPLDKRLMKVIGKSALPSFLFTAGFRQSGLQQIGQTTLMFTPLNVRGGQLQRLGHSRVSTRA